MIKLLVWILLLAGIVTPLILCYSSLKFSRVSQGIDDRYDVDRMLGVDSVAHERFAAVTILGRQMSINPSLVPTLLILGGCLLVVVGLILMMHVSAAPMPND